MVSKPTNTEFKEIFDSAARKYDAVSNPYAVFRRRNFFVAHARGDCLEVGAGTGEIALALKRAGHRVVATDISSNMVSEIQKKGIEAHACDAEKLPFADGTFDTVVGAEMIYYLDNPDAFLQEVHRVLRQGGVLLLFSATNRAKFFDRVRGVLRVLGVGGTYFDDKAHEFIRPKALSHLLQKKQFRVLSMRRMIILPYRIIHVINLVFEKVFGVCIAIRAEKI